VSAVFAIDPGPEESGWVLLEDGKVAGCGVAPNANLRERLFSTTVDTLVAVEVVASYGMAVGRSVFETCVEIGRFIQCAPDPDKVLRVYRQDVKLHLCHSVRAKDQNIRQALIDLLGPPGNKKNPGPTFGVSGHAWAALGVAVTALEQSRAQAA
jgi:hypothetical protein